MRGAGRGDGQVEVEPLGHRCALHAPDFSPTGETVFATSRENLRLRHRDALGRCRTTADSVKQRYARPVPLDRAFPLSFNEITAADQGR
ncbi:hypothetical protein GCM10027360_56390 [Amycolatopsis echigonensis]